MVEGIEMLVNNNYPRSEKGTKSIDEKAYNTLIRDVFQHVLQLRQEIYNRSGYSDGHNEANKHFYQVLKSATSILKKQLDQKRIVVGDCDIEIGIKILERKIDDLCDEHNNSSYNIARKKEKEDEVSNKLKIEGNFLKVIIVKFCTLVLRLWYWRLTFDVPQVEKILKKEDKITFKERVGLIREENKITKEEADLQKVQNKQESQIENLKRKRTGLQGQYNKIHKYIGVKEIKRSIKQKEITDKEKEKIIKEQLGYIESELKAVQSHIHKNNKDVTVFYELNNQKADIENLEATMCSLRKGLESIVRKHEQLAEIQRVVVTLRKNIIEILSENDMKLLKGNLELIAESLHNSNVINYQDKNFIESQIEGLESNNKESKQLAKTIATKLLDSINNASWINKSSIGKRDKKGGKTKLEELYNMISHQTRDLDNQYLATEELKFNCGDAERLLKYFDAFAKEKTRLKEVTKEQAEWQKKVEELEGEKKTLLTYEKQMDICRRLKIVKNINENYDIRSIMWLGIMLTEFLPKLHESKENDTLMMRYISSPVFLELFTNIVAPFANEGNLKIALDIFDPNSSKNGADNICEFYQSLLNKDLNKIKENINNVSANIAQLCVLIVLTKLNHHTNAFGKDLELINSLTFGFINPIHIAQIFTNEKIDDNFGQNKDRSSAADTNSENNNKLRDMVQDIGAKLFSNNKTTEDIFNNVIKKHNPMSKEIRGNYFNTGTTVFSTLNLVMRVLAVVADVQADSVDNHDSVSKTIYNFFCDSSVRRAKEEIARLSEDISQEVAEKSIYECLDTFRTGLNGRDYCTSQQYDDLPATLLNACRVQKLSEDYKKASQDSFPARLMACPSIEGLDRVHIEVSLAR